MHTQAYNRGWIFVQVREVLFPEPHTSILYRQTAAEIPRDYFGTMHLLLLIVQLSFPSVCDHAASNSHCPHQKVTTLGQNEGGM
jgi:hypothetical protein